MIDCLTLGCNFSFALGFKSLRALLYFSKAENSSSPFPFSTRRHCVTLLSKHSELINTPTKTIILMNKNNNNLH